MAQLTWREVAAPNMNITGLTQASGQVVNAFDRAAEMLFRREEDLRKEATNAAVAQAYMANDPEAIAALRAQGLGNLDRRVDRLAYAQALGTAENQIIDRTKTREELANMQAAAQLGDEGAYFVSLMADGKRAEALEYAQTMAKTNPEWGRVAFGFQDKGEGAFSGWDQRRQQGERDAEQKRSNMADERAEQQRIALSQRQVAAQERAAAESRAEQKRNEAAYMRGQQLSREYRLYSPNTAVSMAYENGVFDGMSPSEQRAAMEGFTFGLKPLQTKRDEILSPDPNNPRDRDRVALDNSIARAQGRAQNQISTAQTRARTDPILGALDLSGTYKPQQTSLDAVSRRLENAGGGGWAWEANGARDKVTGWRQQFPNLTNADILAALDTVGYNNGWLNTESGEDKRLETVLAGMNKRRAQSGTAANSGVVVAQETVGAKNALAEIARIEAAIQRYRNAGEPVPQSLIQRLGQLQGAR